jgi:hypothetical protein
MNGWRPIDTYPKCDCGDPECDWGSEVAVLVPSEYGATLYVAHLEAGCWLIRDGEESVCWGGLHGEPTHWTPLPATPSADETSAKTEVV